MLILLLAFFLLVLFFAVVGFCSAWTILASRGIFRFVLLLILGCIFIGIGFVLCIVFLLFV